MDKIEFAILVRAELDKALAELRRADASVEELGDAGRRASRGFEALQRAGFRASQSIRDSLDPARKLHREIVNLRRASARGIISTETSERGIKQLRAQIRALSREEKTASHNMHGLVTGAAALAALYAGARLTQQLADANIEMQRIHFTFVAATGSAAAARREFDWVARQAEELGLNVMHAADGLAQLEAAANGANVPLSEARAIWLAVAKAQTVFHLDAERSNRVFQALIQIMSKGSIQAEELRQQLSEALPIGIIARLADQIGVSVQDVQKMMKRGTLTTRKYLDDLIAAIEGAVDPDALHEAAHGLNAELNRLHSTLFDIQTDPALGFADELAESVRTLNETLNDPGIRSGLQEFIQLLGQLLNVSVKVAAAIGDTVSAVQLSTLQGWRRANQQQIDNAIDELEAGRTQNAAFDFLNHDLSAEERAARRERIRKLQQDNADYAARIQAILNHRPGAPAETAAKTPAITTDFGPYASGYRGAGAPASDTDTQTSAAGKLLAQLQAQGAAYGQTAAAALRYKLETQGATEAEIQAALAQQDVNASLAFLQQMGERAAQTKQAAAQAAREHQAALEQEAAAIQDQLDPTRVLVRQLAHINELVAATSLTPKEGRAQDVAYVVQMVEGYGDLAAQITKVQQLAAQGVIPPEVADGAAAQLKKIDQAAQDTGTQMNQFAVQAARNIQDSFANFLFDPFQDGLDGLVDSFSDALRQMAAQMASKAILTAFFNAMGWQIPGYTGATKTLAGGGYVAGPGTTTSDSIPARLSDGEFVVRAAAVKHWGVGFLNAINRSTRPSVGHRFANGGLVTAASTAGGGNTYVEVVNNTGAQARTERSRRSNGDELVRIVIGQVAGDIVRGGRTAQAMEQTFGLQRQGRR